MDGVVEVLVVELVDDDVVVVVGEELVVVLVVDVESSWMYTSDRVGSSTVAVAVSPMIR